MGNSQPNIDKKDFKKNLENKLQVFDPYPPPDAKTIKTQSKRPTKPAPQRVQTIELDAQPIQGKDEKVVNAKDGREPVQRPAKWPNSVHGIIAFKVKDFKAWGTGILIGRHIVLTAGHNLYDHQTRAYSDVESLQFLPGMNGQALPFGAIGVEQYFVSPNFIKDKEKEDYGILILKKPIGEVAGYFGLACLEPEEIKKKRINITGYPYDKVVQKSYQMWGMEGEVSHIDQNGGHINYLIDTEAGQSGSGIWYQEGDDYYVCGVHTTGTEFVNTGTLLTRAIYKQIHAWIQQVGVMEFLSKLKDTKDLVFKYQEINAECLALLIKYNLENLLGLYLSCKTIRNEEAKILAQNVSWTKLERLDLSKNNIGAEGAKALAENTSWINLSYLDLGKNHIGPKGAKALAQNTSWINLSKLNLQQNYIFTEGAKALAQNTSWTNLSYLDVFWNDIDEEGRRALCLNFTWKGDIELFINSPDWSGMEKTLENLL